LDVSSLNSL